VCVCVCVCVCVRERERERKKERERLGRQWSRIKVTESAVAYLNVLLTYMVRRIKVPATYPHLVTGCDSQMPSVKKKRKLKHRSVLFGNKIDKFVTILYVSFYVFLEEH